jgi:DNA-binding CsgD family transcriptional regulator/tetratricopeptide (TPR) repeat protein
MMDRVSGSPKLPDLDDPLPGRERETSELATILNQALHGAGRVVLVSGEAGIGKTTLTERLAAQARSHAAQVLIGHCYAMTANQPFAPWREIRTFLSPGSNDLANSGSKEELFEQVSHILREETSRHPLVIILEDIHWADTASLELLRHLVRQISVIPTLLVATYREDDPDTTSTLPGILPDLVRESRATRFPLQPLTLHDIHSFITSDMVKAPLPEDATPFATYLYERSEGNPFFMIELLHDLTRREDSTSFAPAKQADAAVLPVPSLIRNVIESRIDRLNASTRDLLNIAAVIGQEVPVDLWQAVAKTDDTALISAIEEAIEHHILRESGDDQSVRFIHGLVQETLYLGQIALRRKAMHRQIAEYLMSQPRRSPDSVAHHFSRAGDVRAIEWLVRAGETALSIYAARDAIRSIDRASRLAQETGGVFPLAAYRIRAQACELLGESERARQTYEALLKVARAANDREMECQTLIDLGLKWSDTDYQQSGEYLKQARSISRILGDFALEAQCLNRLANWQVNIGDFDEAVDLHRQALRMFEEINDEDGIADTLDLLGTCTFMAGDYKSGTDYLERSVAISRRQNNKWRLASSLALLCNIGGDMDATFDTATILSRSPDYWIRAGVDSVETARDIGWLSGESFGLSMLGAVHCARGNLAEALRCGERAEAIAERIRHQQWLVAASLLVGITWAELLDHSRASYYLERSLHQARSMGSNLWTNVAAAGLANLSLERGDTSGIHLLEEFVETELTGRSHAQRIFQRAWANQLRANGRLDEALEVIDTLIGYDDINNSGISAPQSLLIRAEILEGMGRMAEAEQTLAEASRSSDLLGYRTMQWRVNLAQAVFKARHGGSTEAAEHVQTARAAAESIARELENPDASHRFLNGVEARINAVPALSGTQDSPGGLSPRETEVLRLVAIGLTDAQVAEQLFISPRTVARHLQSIYTKLNVNSRTAATRFALEHKIVS